MLKVLQPFVSLGLRSLFHAVDTMLHKEDEDVTQTDRQPQFNFSLNCQGVDSNHRWEGGPAFYRSVSQGLYYPDKLFVPGIRGPRPR